jgi:peroxiredoxin Q/BCP
MKKLSVLALLFIPFLLALAPGANAPDFSAKNQDGKTIRLSDFKGKWLLIYFYPKDDTPGCKKEACSFRDEFSKIKKLNVSILGVSRQDEKSHQEFKSKYKLPFDLLVDKDGSLADSFGVGSIPILGMTQRQSILIGPDGKIIQFYKDVDPDTHAQQVMKDVQHYNDSI